MKELKKNRTLIIEVELFIYLYPERIEKFGEKICVPQNYSLYLQRI